MRILIIEDHKKIAEYLQKSLQQRSYAVDCLFDGITGEQRAMTDAYDLIILDIMLPGRDGIQVCQNLREAGVMTPVLMLTARGELDDRIAGLDMGADDYLVKPFDLNELLARVRALLRRPKHVQQDALRLQDLEIDEVRHAVTQAGSPVSLTIKEYAILVYLMRHKGQALSREQILDSCWGFSTDAYSNIVDVHIRRLRKKLHDADERYIKTIRGLGYRAEA